MPPVNDNLANARLVSTVGLTSFSDTTVDSTVETGKETDDGYVNTVWYRVEPATGVDLKINLDSASFEYYFEVYIFPGGGTPADFADLVNGYSNYVDGSSGPGPTEIIVSGTSDVYYVLVTSNSFIEGDEGAFDISFFLPAVYLLDAEDYANLSSSTVSLQSGSPQYVRDVQYRNYDFTNFGDSFKGPLEYTPTLIIPAGTVPSGRYRLEGYGQLGNIGGANNEGIITQILQGTDAMPEAPQYGLGFGPITDGVDEWYAFTDDTGWGDLPLSIDHHDQGGPLWVDTSKDIHLCIGQTSEAESSAGNGKRWMQLQTLKLTSVANGPPLSNRWILQKHGMEPFGFMIEGQSRCREKPDGSGFYVSGHHYNNVSGEERFSIWEFSLNGDEIELVSAQGLGNQDLKEVPWPTSTTAIWWHDFTVMPNGDIYVIAFENGTITQHRTWLKMWDGSSWSTLSGDLGGHTAGTNWWQYSCSIDNDGTDVYMAWGEHKSGGSNYLSNDWGIRIKKYDVGGASFSELGTSSGNGLTAYPAIYSGAGSPYTLAGNGGQPVKLRVAPDGVPWLAFNEYDETIGATNPTKNDRPFVYYWDGAAWVSTGAESEVPNTAPTAISGHSWSTTPTVGNNYLRIVSDDTDALDMIFCHHDGPSNYPAIAHQWVWSDQVGNLDWVDWAYMEYDGGAWVNKVVKASRLMAPAKDEIFGIAGYDGTHWQGGMSLSDDGQVPYLFWQAAQQSGTLIQVCAHKIKADGSDWKDLGGDEYPDFDTAFAAGHLNFVDQPSNPGQLQNGGNWADSSEAGLIVNGRAVGVFYWWNGWQFIGWALTIWKPGGGVVSMHWRVGEETLTTEMITNR